MRAQLQFRTWPWAWLGFAAFLMIYAEGFLHDLLREVGPGTGLRLLMPLAIGVALTYAVLFGEAKDVVRYRWSLRSLRTGDWRRALALLPLWIPTYAVVVALATLVATRIGPIALDGYLQQDLRNIGILPEPAVFVALPCFLARDIALVLALNFGRRSRRADLSAFVYLLVLYGPLPGIITMLGVTPLASFFYPASVGGVLSTVGPPAAEALVMIALLAVRWRAANQAIRPAAVETAAAPT
jgi:hypothetical protein